MTLTHIVIAILIATTVMDFLLIRQIRKDYHSLLNNMRARKEADDA